MKIYIKSSAGDIELCKFVFIPMKKIDSLCENDYDEKLKGYFYIWNYTYNPLTKTTDDRMYTHSDTIDNLPYEIRKQAKELTIWGKTDYFNNDVRFIIVNDEYLTDYQLNLIKRYCKE